MPADWGGPLSPLRHRGQVAPRTSPTRAHAGRAADKENPPASARRAPSALPAGWVSHIDPRSALPYYHHHESGVTQWERPGTVDPAFRSPTKPPPAPPHAQRWTATVETSPSQASAERAPGAGASASAGARAASAVCGCVGGIRELVLHVMRAFSDLSTPLATTHERDTIGALHDVHAAGTFNLLAWRRAALTVALALSLASAVCATHDASVARSDLQLWAAVAARPTDGTTARGCALEPRDGDAAVRRACAHGLIAYTHQVLQVGLARTLLDAKGLDAALTAVLAVVQWLALVPCAFALLRWEQYWLSLRLVRACWLLAFVSPFALSMIPFKTSIGDAPMASVGADYADELRQVLGLATARALDAGGLRAPRRGERDDDATRADASARAAASEGVGALPLDASPLPPSPPPPARVLPQCEVFRVDPAADIFAFYSKFELLCGGGAEFASMLARDGLDGAARAHDANRTDAAVHTAAEAALRYVHRGVAEPAALAAGCADAPGWAVSADVRVRGVSEALIDCAQLERRGFCDKGHVLAMHRHWLNARPDDGGVSAEANCCACGRGRALEERARAAEAEAKAAARLVAPPFPLPGDPAFLALPPAQQACARAHARRRAGAKAEAAEALLVACDTFFALPADGSALAAALDRSALAGAVRAEADRAEARARGDGDGGASLGAAADASAHEAGWEAAIPDALRVLFDRTRAATATTVAVLRAGSSLRTLVPSALSLAPGLLRGALTTKTLVPQSSIPGMFILLLPWLYCPLCWCLYDVVLQLSGSLALLAGLATLAFAPMAVAGIGIATAITRPMSDRRMRQVLRMIRWHNLGCFVFAYANFALVALSHTPSRLPKELVDVLVPRLLRPDALVSVAVSVSSKFVLTTLIGVDLMISEIAEQRHWELYLASGGSLADELRARLTQSEFEDVRRLMDERNTRLDELCTVLRKPGERGAAPVMTPGSKGLPSSRQKRGRVSLM